MKEKRYIVVNPVVPNQGVLDQRFKEFVKKIADAEARKQLTKYIDQQFPGQADQAFLAEISPDLTTATGPDGVNYIATVIGENPQSVTPFFKLDETRGVAYVPDVYRVSADFVGGQGLVAEYKAGDGVYIRQLGKRTGARVPFSFPAKIINEFPDRIQAIFSANSDHLLVGYWIQNEDSPYETRAVYSLYTNITLGYTEEIAEFGYATVQSESINLNELADEKAIPPQPGEQPATSYIWLYWPGDQVGEQSRFFPLLSSYYELTTPTYPMVLTFGLYYATGTFQYEQLGTANVTWVLDPHTLAVFQNVKFVMNNDASGLPKIDILAGFQAVTAAYRDSFTTEEEVNYHWNTPLGWVIDGQYSQNQRQVKYTYSYSLDYPYVPPSRGAYGEGYMHYEFENTTSPSTITVGNAGTMSNSPYGTSGAGFSNMDFSDNCPGAPCCPYDYCVTGECDGDCFWNYVSVTGALGTQSGWTFQGSAEDVGFLSVTAYDGVERRNGVASIPVPQSFIWYEISCCILMAGYFTNLYWSSLGYLVSFFCNAYYFARAQMYLTDVTGARNLSFRGDPPEMAQDLNYIHAGYRGINQTTAEIYYQTNSIYDNSTYNPATDPSVIDLVNMLAESLGLTPAERDALYQLFISDASLVAEYIPLTQAVYWYSGAYGADPYFGYLQPPDAFTDRLFAGPGQWPFTDTYVKGLDSLITIGYSRQGSNEAITIYESQESGETSVFTRTIVPYVGSIGSLLDVGRSYGTRAPSIA